MSTNEEDRGDGQEWPEPGDGMPWWRYGLSWGNLSVGSFGVPFAATMNDPINAVLFFVMCAFSWLLGVHRLRRHHRGEGLPLFGGAK